jgi:hypothetical protein
MVDPAVHKINLAEIKPFEVEEGEWNKTGAGAAKAGAY